MEKPRSLAPSTAQFLQNFMKGELDGPADMMSNSCWRSTPARSATANACDMAQTEGMPMKLLISLAV